MPDLGRAALVTSFLLLVYASVAGAFAAWHRRRRLAESAQNALLGAFAATVVAAAVLLSALARHDLSFTYVAQHTSRELPLGYTLTAFWGGQEGSLLLWLLVLCGYSVAAVLTARRGARGARMGRADARRGRDVLRAAARIRRQPVRDAARAGGRSRPQPQPAEP